MTQYTIEVRKGKKGKWYYVILGGNGKVGSTSEMYASKGNAIRAAVHLHYGLWPCPVNVRVRHERGIWTPLQRYCYP